MTAADDVFTRDLADSRRIERRLLWKELLAVLVVVAIVVVRALWFA